MSLGRLFVTVGADTTEFERKMQGLQGSLRNAGQSLQRTGGAMTTLFTLPLMAAGAALGGAVKVAADFESQMARVGAIAGATGDDFDTLNDLAREMGRTTSFSATQAAQGLEYLAMAGWDTAEMAEGLEPILRLAEATQMDLGRASDIASDMMSAFGMEATEVGRITDVLAKTATTANTDVEMLGETMKYAAPAAAALGWEIEDAAAMAGVLANAGIKGSMAGTTLNAVMADLTSISGDAQAEMKRLGVSVFDAEGNMRSSVDIITDMERATKDMSDEQRTAFLGMIFGQRAMRGVNILLGEGGEALGEYTNELYGAEGAVEEMGEKTRDTLAYQLKELRSIMEGLAIDMGETLIPIIREHLIPIIIRLADWVKRAIEWWAGLDERWQKVILVAGVVLAALGPLLIIVGKIVTAIGVLIPVVTKIGAVFAVAGKIIAAIAVGASAPLVLIVAAVAAVIAIGIALWRNWDRISEFARKIWGEIRDTIVGFAKRIYDGVVGWFTDIYHAIVGTIESVIAPVERALGWISRLFGRAERDVNSHVDSLTGGVVEGFQGMADNIVLDSIVPDMWDAIGYETEQGTARMLNTTRQATKEMMDMWTVTADAIGTKTGFVTDAHTKTVKDVEVSADAIGTAMGFVTDVQTRAKEFATDAFSAIERVVQPWVAFEGLPAGLAVGHMGSGLGRRVGESAVSATPRTAFGGATTIDVSGDIRVHVDVTGEGAMQIDRRKLTEVVGDALTQLIRDGDRGLPNQYARTGVTW